MGRARHPAQVCQKSRNVCNVCNVRDEGKSPISLKEGGGEREYRGKGGGNVCNVCKVCNEEESIDDEEADESQEDEEGFTQER